MLVGFYLQYNKEFAEIIRDSTKRDLWETMHIYTKITIILHFFGVFFGFIDEFPLKVEEYAAKNRAKHQ